MPTAGRIASPAKKSTGPAPCFQARIAALSQRTQSHDTTKADATMAAAKMIHRMRVLRRIIGAGEWRGVDHAWRLPMIDRVKGGETGAEVGRRVHRFSPISTSSPYTVDSMGMRAVARLPTSSA